MQVNYGYNGIGERAVRAPGNGSTSTFIYDDAGQWLGEYQNGQMQQQVIWLNNYPMVVATANLASPLAYIQPDHLGHRVSWSWLVCRPSAVI